MDDLYLIVYNDDRCIIKVPYFEGRHPTGAPAFQTFAQAKMFLTTHYENLIEVYDDRLYNLKYLEKKDVF